jgi:hypothetical protein
VDTRGNGAPIQGGIFTGGSDVRNYTISGICGVPGGIGAVSLNFTVVGPLGSGFLVSWPTGGAVPLVSILNFTAGQTVANAAVVPTNVSGSITVNVSASTHLLVDINGYYAGGVVTSVAAGTGLTGGGTGDVTVAIAAGGVGSNELASNAVTSSKIAANAVTAGAIAPSQVVKSLNGLFDGITLAAGPNVTITPSAQTLTIASTGTGVPSGAFVLGNPADTTLIGAGFSEVAPSSQDLWTPTSTVGAPTARYFHTAVWTGSRMIVWGGYSGSAVLNTGGRYDPVSDSWSATSTSGPTARAAHTAVWTGTEMVVWGGVDITNTAFNTGSRYDPVMDTWTATPTAGGPSARSLHTAVWDAADGVMLVWGGVDSGNNPLNDGGRLNVGFASWGLITTLNAPTARAGHTAVWTGSQMIVWGGYDSMGFVLNTGGLFTPPFSWAPTDTVFAPLARSLHAAVWTGTAMIVWGGYNAGDLASGAQYFPSGDVWIPISMIGAPTARSAPTAVWTGSKMIVWGGRFQFSTGGLYDPSDDSWVATNRAGAPAGRYTHTAVWTGSRMIIWGGKNISSAFNTGGQYRVLSLYRKN